MNIFNSAEQRDMGVAMSSKFLTACALLACTSAVNAQQQSITEQAALDKLLASIPVNHRAMPHANLLERLDSLGMTVKRVMYGTVTADEVKIDPDHIKRGDVLYSFTTSEPPDRVKQMCSFWSSFSLTKRNGRWLVQDRAGNFLLQNQCSLPR